MKPLKIEPKKKKKKWFGEKKTHLLGHKKNYFCIFFYKLLFNINYVILYVSFMISINSNKFNLTIKTESIKM